MEIKTLWQCILHIVPPPCVEIENAPARYLFAPCTAFCRVDAEPKLNNEAFAFDYAVTRVLDTPSAKVWRANERSPSLADTAISAQIGHGQERQHLLHHLARELLPRTHRPPQTINRRPSCSPFFSGIRLNVNSTYISSTRGSHSLTCTIISLTAAQQGGSRSQQLEVSPSSNICNTERDSGSRDGKSTCGQSLLTINLKSQELRLFCNV